MTVTETFPIHRCIYRNDQNALRELLMDSEMKKRINERDNHGNTPIHLALMLDRRNCIITLLSCKCDVYTRNSCGWNPLDEAILIGDIDIIERLSYLKWRELIDKISCPGGFLDQWTSVLPNLYLKYKLRLKTSIPLLQKLGAKDIQEIIKKGSSIRFNTSITGIDSRGIPKILKGSISVIGKFDEKSGIYRIILLDNKKKLYQEFFPNIPQWYLNNSLKSKIGVNTLYKFFVDISEFNVKQKKSSVLKKTKKTFNLADGKSYKAELFSSKNIKIIVRRRKDEAIIGVCKSDIKMKASKENEITTIFKKYEDQNATANKKVYDDDDDENDSESDEESSYSEEEEDKSYNNISSVIFKEYVNETDPEKTENDPKTVQKIISILEKGYDSNNNKVTDSDMEYLDKYVPNILKTYLSKSNTNKSNNDPNRRSNFFDESAPANSSMINYSISQDGNTRTYDIVDESQNTLDWEAAYNMKYSQNNDIIYDYIVNGNHKETVDESNNNLTLQKFCKAKENVISEEEYFNPSSTEKYHMGRIMNITDEVKNFKRVGKCWMSKEGTLPVNFAQLNPLFEFIYSMFFDQVNQSDNEMAIYDRFRSIIDTNVHGDKRFPLKIVIPIYPSIKAQYKAMDVSADPERIPDSLFEIPNNYKYGNVYFNNIN